MDLSAAVPLATASAALYGAADFFGGIAARRSSGIAAATVAQTSGVLLVAAVALLVGGSPTRSDMIWGGLSGIAGGAGLALFFQALAIGRMATIAPITASTCAIVPIAIGIALGERPSPTAIAGIVLAGIAIVLVSRETVHPEQVAEPMTSGTRASAGRAIVLALLAGIFFGGFYSTLAQTGRDAGLWPIFANRACSTPMLWLLFGLQRGPGWRALITPRMARVAVLSGVVDISANSLFLLASRQGALSIVGTVASLYPASTVLLAVIVLRERLDRWQTVGLITTIGAIVLIARG